MTRYRWPSPAPALPVLGAVLLLLAVQVSGLVRRGAAGAAPLAVSAAEAPPPAAPAPADPGSAPAVPGAEGRSASAPNARGAARTLLVRTVGPLTPSLLEDLRAAAGGSTIAEVRGGQVQLLTGRSRDGRTLDTPPPGFAIPLATIGVDPEAYSRLLPPGDRPRVRELAPGEALLGMTSATLRRLGTGGELELVDGRRLHVAGVVDDRLIGSAEVVVSLDTARSLGVDELEYLLVGGEGFDRAVADAVAALAARSSGVRAEELGPGPWRPAWRTVLPQALVKQRFGEVAVAPAGDGLVTLDPAWAQANLVTTSVPLVGTVTCHRAMLPALTAAMSELERRQLGHLVDPEDFQGCWNPVLRVTPATLSAHAWGLAVDLNASANPEGSPSRQDPRLVEIMEAQGFVAGARWPVPDAMHFEYRG